MNREKVLSDIDRVLYYNEIDLSMNELEKCRLGIVKLLNPNEPTKGIPAFRDLREAYHTLGGDDSLNGTFLRNKASAGLRACMDFNSGSFAYALQDAMNVHLTKAYGDFPYREEILISDKKRARDFRTIHSVQLGYFQDLPDVDPETADYQSPAEYADSEAQYSVGIKGMIVWISRKVIMNNLIDLITATTTRAAKAARRTHARHVWNIFLNNATCPDGTAWFTSTHGNLGSSAMSITAVSTGISVLANMTEPAPSAEPIGLDLASAKWHLVSSASLWETAVKVNQIDSYYTANDLTTKTVNPCRHFFGEKNERVITCPFMTSLDEWGIIRNKEDVPLVEMSYLNGAENPEFMVHQGPTDEHVFKDDRIGYKIRHEYGGNLADYRGGYKSIP